MRADRANSHCESLDSFSYFIGYFYCVSVFCVSCVLCHFSPPYSECFVPDPGFLGVNNKRFKAFCTLARHHYLEIC